MDSSLSWRIASASSTGTGHLSKAVECQDSSCFSFAKSIRGEEKTLLIVVSDGAGSAAYASRGSRLVCNSIVDCAQYWLRKSIPADLSGLLLHSAGHARQALLKAANAEGVSISEFSATCLCLLITENSLAALQVGDGLIVVENGSGSIGPVFWPRKYEYANTTTFLTSRNWFQDLQYSQWIGSPRSFFICSDGIQSICSYSQSMAVVPSFVDAFKKVLSDESPGYSSEASKRILTFLDSEQVCSRTDDDKTVFVGIKYQ
jgi:hypothetical protein